MGGPLTKGEWLTQAAHQVAHAFGNRNASLSEGEALAVVVQVVAGNPHGTRVGADSPKPSAVRRGVAPASRVHPLARCVVAPHGRGGSGGSDPHVLTASAAPGRVSRFTSQFTVNPPLGVAPSTVIPGGKAIERCRGLGPINRSVRFPHRRRDLRSLRGKSVQEAFRGALLCQGVESPACPAKLADSGGAGRRRTLPRRFSRHRGLGHGRGGRERRG